MRVAKLDREQVVSERSRTFAPGLADLAFSGFQDVSGSKAKDYLLNHVRLWLALGALLFFVPWSLSRCEC